MHYFWNVYSVQMEHLIGHPRQLIIKGWSCCSQGLVAFRIRILMPIGKHVEHAGVRFRLSTGSSGVNLLSQQSVVNVNWSRGWCSCSPCRSIIGSRRWRNRVCRISSSSRGQWWSCWWSHFRGSHCTVLRHISWRKGALQIASVGPQQFQNLSLLLCNLVILFCDSCFPIV